MTHNLDTGPHQPPRAPLPAPQPDDSNESRLEQWREFLASERDWPSAELDAALDDALVQLLEDARRSF